jgi:hypothetical protein
LVDERGNVVGVVSAMMTPDWNFAVLAREVKSHMVLGDHRSVLKNPHVRRLAEERQATLGARK